MWLQIEYVLTLWAWAQVLREWYLEEARGTEDSETCWEIPDESLNPHKMVPQFVS